MDVKEEISRLKDEFIGLHAEYKSLFVDESSPPQEGNYHEDVACEKLVSQMAEIIFKMAVLSIQHIDKQDRKIAFLSAKMTYTRKTTVEDQTADNDAEDSIQELLCPEVCLNVGSSICSREDSPIDIAESASDCDTLTSDKDASNRAQQRPRPQILSHERKVVMEQKSKTAPVQRPVQQLRGRIARPHKESNQRERPVLPWPRHKFEYFKLRELSERWFNNNRPPPPPQPDEKYSIHKLTTEQRREGYDFYLKYKDLFDRKVIVECLMEKYYLSLARATGLINRGDDGSSFKSGNWGGVPSKMARNPEMVAEMVAYCKANPFTFSVNKLSEKYGIHRQSLSIELKKHGIKCYTSAERRALKLNMEGKEYKPHVENPELLKYRKLLIAERKKRRKEGDMRDGRSARHKDPTWKSPKELAGVPEGMIVYDKEYHKKWESKRVLRSRSDLKAKVVRAKRKDSEPSQDEESEDHEEDDEEDTEDEDEQDQEDDQLYRIEMVSRRKQKFVKTCPTVKKTSPKKAKRSTGKKVSKKSTPVEVEEDQPSQTSASNQPSTQTVDFSHLTGHSSSVWQMPGCDPYTSGTGGHSHATRSLTSSALQSQSMVPYVHPNHLQTDYSQYFQSFNTNQPEAHYNPHHHYY